MTDALRYVCIPETPLFNIINNYITFWSSKSIIISWDYIYIHCTLKNSYSDIITYRLIHVPTTGTLIMGSGNGLIYIHVGISDVSR